MNKQINTFKILIFLIGISSCLSSNERRWTKTDMTNLIKEKTDLKINENFQIIEDSVISTDGAFDLDYTYILKIKYDQKIEKNIIDQITNSLFFDTIRMANYADPIWKIINLKTNKGIWANNEESFQFLQCKNDINSIEPFYFEIDTLTNKMSLTLIHL